MKIWTTKWKRVVEFLPPSRMLDQRIEHGVWGGCSERERRRILKRRRVDAEI